jgi:hypothetical protein
MTRTKKRHAGTIEDDQKKQFIKRITSETFNDEVRKTWNGEHSDHQRIIEDYSNPRIKKYIAFASKHGLPWTIEQSDKARQLHPAPERASNTNTAPDHASITREMDALKLMGGYRRRTARRRRTHRRRTHCRRRS